MRITMEHLSGALSAGICEQKLIEDYLDQEKKDFQVVFAYMTEQFRNQTGKTSR